MTTTTTTTTDVTAVPGAPVPAGWAAGTWVIDPAHTVAGFAVRHLMSRVRGTFSQVSGQIVTGPEPSRSAATATIGVASVTTGNPMRDDHLRSADFFDAGRFPELTFASTAVRPAQGRWVLSGDLTIRDVTRPAELEAEFLGTDPAGLQGETRIGFSARGTISRRDFGITFGLAADATKIVIGDKVEITLAVEAFLAA
jgi:polyisoprenoid-binding protein YceI